MPSSSRPTRRFRIEYERDGEVVASVDVRPEDNRWYANVHVIDEAGSTLHVTRPHATTDEAIADAEAFVRARCGPSVVARR